MIVSIIGGGGLVGSCAAFALQCSGIARELVLVDVNQDLVNGQMLDLLHGGPSTSDQIIRTGDYACAAKSDVICITAGLRRKPDESRLDLINRNTQLFVSILDQIKSQTINPNAIVVVVSNPVDILTYVAATRLGLPASQVIGLGTQLDTIRFRSFIAQNAKVAPSQINALILGEHGDSMVPIWSSAAIAGLPIDKFPGWTAHVADSIFTRTKGSGAEVIKGKGGAGFAVGVAIRDVIDAVLLNKQVTLPVSSVQTGNCWGIRDVALSVPTVVGRKGVERCFEVDLWPKENQGLKRSGQVLKQTLDQVLANIG